MVNITSSATDPAPPEPEEKWCPACGEKRPRSDFNKSKRYKDGLHYRCRRHEASYTGTGSSWHGWGRHITPREGRERW